MTFTLTEIFFIIGLHWVSDFIFQAEKWALGKSKSWKDLLSHTTLYSLFWICISIFLSLKATVLFMIATFLCHTVTDYFTSRKVSQKFAKKEYGSPIPNFGAFTYIGFDQVLHYFQLFLTYYYLKGWGY